MGILVEFPHETMCVNLLVMLEGKSELLGVLFANC